MNKPVAAILVLVMFLGCENPGQSSGHVNPVLTFTPSPPVVGVATFELDLLDPAGKPMAAENLGVEANMNHAGMSPSFATVTTIAPGRYRGEVEFTMAGDWFILVLGEMIGGESFQHKINVPAVSHP